MSDSCSSKCTIAKGGEGGGGKKAKRGLGGGANSGAPVNNNVIRQWCVGTMCFVHPKKVTKEKKMSYETVKRHPVSVW